MKVCSFLFSIHLLTCFRFYPIETLESGWKDDRQLEDKAAQNDLAHIDDLTVLLEYTEKRKAKVESIVYRLLGELQQLKYYLEGMSNPSTPTLPIPTPGRYFYHSHTYTFPLFFLF